MKISQRDLMTQSFFVHKTFLKRLEYLPRFEYRLAVWEHLKPMFLFQTSSRASYKDGTSRCMMLRYLGFLSCVLVYESKNCQQPFYLCVIRDFLTRKRLLTFLKFSGLILIKIVPSSLTLKWADFMLWIVAGFLTRR